MFESMLVMVVEARCACMTWLPHYWVARRELELTIDIAQLTTEVFDIFAARLKEKDYCRLIFVGEAMLSCLYVTVGVGNFETGEGGSAAWKGGSAG